MDGSPIGVLLACAALSSLEKEVLQVRFGSPGRVSTYAEAARRLGIPVDALCQIEIGALQKLRRSSLEAHASAVGGWDEV